MHNLLNIIPTICLLKFSNFHLHYYFSLSPANLHQNIPNFYNPNPTPKLPTTQTPLNTRTNSPTNFADQPRKILNPARQLIIRRKRRRRAIPGSSVAEKFRRRGRTVPRYSIPAFAIKAASGRRNRGAPETRL